MIDGGSGGKEGNRGSGRWFRRSHPVSRGGFVYPINHSSPKHTKSPVKSHLIALSPISMPVINSPPPIPIPSVALLLNVLGPPVIPTSVEYHRYHRCHLVVFHRIHSRSSRIEPFVHFLCCWPSICDSMYRSSSALRGGFVGSGGWRSWFGVCGLVDAVYIL